MILEIYIGRIVSLMTLLGQLVTELIVHSKITTADDSSATVTLKSTSTWVEVHVSTHIPIGHIVKALAVAVEFGVFKLSIAQLLENLLTEASAAFGHTRVDASIVDGELASIQHLSSIHLSWTECWLAISISEAILHF